jgi:hypothetical protein
LFNNLYQIGLMLYAANGRSSANSTYRLPYNALHAY